MHFLEPCLTIVTIETKSCHANLNRTVLLHVNGAYVVRLMCVCGEAVCNQTFGRSSFSHRNWMALRYREPKTRSNEPDLGKKKKKKNLLAEKHNVGFLQKVQRMPQSNTFVILH